MDRGTQERQSSIRVIVRRLKRRRSNASVPPEIIGTSLLAAHNLIAHRVLRPPADAGLNFVSAAALTALTLQTGSTIEDLGLARSDLRQGLITGSVGAACCCSVVGAIAAIPSTRRFFFDDRLMHMSQRETLYHAALRIPVATALTEEIMFRSALHALVARKHGSRRAVIWTSVIFGMWHILPTLETYEGNPVSNLSDGSSARTKTAFGIAGATACAGFFFSQLRLRSKSVAAPAMTHAVINLSAFLIGRALVGRNARIID